MNVYNKQSWILRQIRECLFAKGLLGLAVIALSWGFAIAQDKEDWNSVLSAAKKESRVLVYGVSTFRPMIKEIEAVLANRFGIKIDFLAGRSREVRERIKMEVRTGKPVADVAMAGATSLPALWRDGGLERWFPPSLKFVRPVVLETLDVDKFPMTPVYAGLKGVLINTNLISAREEPKSWRDIANPKWRGKIIMDDPRSAGAGHGAFVSTWRHPSLGREFHEKLAQNKLVFLGAGTYQQIATKIAQGEYAIGLPIDADAVVDFANAPVKWIAPAEGVHHTVMAVALVKNAARSNAAKVFIDFVLSEEFQRVVGDSNAPVREGIASKRKEWSLDYTTLLPRPLVETAEELQEFYRLAESIYGIR